MNNRINPWRALSALGIAAIALAGCGSGGDSAGPVVARDNPATVSILSSPAALVSGTTALVDVVVDDTSSPITATLNGASVSGAFKIDPAHPGHLLGTVSGVTPGANVLQVGWRSASTTFNFTGYPITGPIISGPHQTPFICQTATFKLPDGSTLGPALDADCTAAPKITYMYLKTGGTALVPMPDVTVRPADVASTTTSAGVTVPFIVRVETSTVNRGIYQSAMLHDPTTEADPAPLAPPKAWNRRLIAIEGLGCQGGWYIQGGAQGTYTSNGFEFNQLSLKRLGEGYATFANTLQHAGNDCNVVLQSETLMMSKEAFIKVHGVPDFTVSAGCSGGASGSTNPVDRIPGLFDGVLIACEYPDALTEALVGADDHLFTHYWAVTAPTGFTDAQKIAITGYKTTFGIVVAGANNVRLDPVPNRVDITGYTSATWNSAVPVGLRYDPIANPTGARPTIFDAGKNIYGVDKSTGFGLRVYDNTGVQYGLTALNAGVITTTQFLDLNANIGGYDQDANYVANRSIADLGAITRAQQAGMQLYGGGGLADIPIMDVSGTYNEDGDYHNQWAHFAVRERVLQANGDSQNFVMWRGNPVPADAAWSAFISWVVAYKADVATGTQRAKVIRDKPAGVTDGCWSSTTNFIKETQTLDNAASTTCNGLFPSWTYPRVQAGGPVAANILKCTLTPVVANGYRVTFTAAELARLNAIFPTGVCDYGRPGVNQTTVVLNGSFGPAPDHLVYDITK